MASVGEAVTDPAHDESVAILEDDAVRRVDLVVWGLALVVAIAVRVALVRSPNGTIHGDEAVVGLMAHNLLDGEPRVFYWGQDYGGSLEAFVAAVAFVPFGTSVAALKISTLVLDAVASLFVFLVGRRLVGVRAAGYATAMFLIGPVGITALSLSSRGFYWSTLICGLVMVLFALRGLDRPARRLDWFVSGIAAGVGFWQSPQILYFAIPVIIFVAVRLGRAVLSAWPAVAGAGLGALPWLEVNMRDGFPSLDSPPQAVATTYVERLRVFGDEGVPVALGLQLATGLGRSGPRAPRLGCPRRVGRRGVRPASAAELAPHRHVARVRRSCSRSSRSHGPLGRGATCSSRFPSSPWRSRTPRDGARCRSPLSRSLRCSPSRGSTISVT